MSRTVHVIGAGISGLSAAVRLAAANCRVHVHEATQMFGGRCRSYFDGATGLTIDNGNHLLLSGNANVLAYAETIGSAAGLQGPDRAAFDFVDLAADKRWTLEISDGRVPSWIFDSTKRVPDTRWSDYLALAPLLWAAADAKVGDVITCKGVLYDRLVQPLLLAALNIDPPLGSAALAAAIVRETLLRGGSACRPLVAREGLSSVLIDPAIAFVRSRGGSVELGRELQRIDTEKDRTAGLVFGDSAIPVGADDAVVLAVPPRAATGLLSELRAPTRFCAIVNAHFKFAPPAKLPVVTGVVGGLIEWLFSFPERLSVTISGGDRLVDQPRQELAQAIWADVCKVADIKADLPPWQIVRERRATFEATPDQNAMRPGAVTSLRNLFLAGDWTDTGLPATIEGSVRSGNRAADLVLAMS